MSVQAAYEVNADAVAYVDNADEAGSSDSRWAFKPKDIPIRPSQPRKPDGPRGVDSLRKRIAVKSMGDLPNMRSPAPIAVQQQQQQQQQLQQHIDDSACFGPCRNDVPCTASSSRHVVDDQGKLRHQAVGHASTIGMRAGHASTSGHLPSHRHISTSLSLTNRLSEDSELEADNREDSDSEHSDELSECSEEASSEDEEEEAVAGLLSCLRLHPAHVLFADQAKEDKCLASHRPVSLPGCSTAQQLAEAAAKDPHLGEPRMSFDFAVLQGKVFGAAECMTIGIDLVCSEIAFASSWGQPQHCAIAVVPRSEQPKSPARQKSSDGKMQKPKQTADEVRGWLFTCPTEVTKEILELFGQNGAVRQNLEACFNLIPDAKAGSGTFGSIIRASCANKPGRDIAVKVMKNNAKETTIQSEIAMLVAAQGSPVIVKFFSAFYDVCPRSGHKIWALAFEGYPGDLYDRASEGKRMMEADAMPLAQDLLLAISFLQDREIFHRDIKPENLLMTNSGGVVLTDFGIATHLSNLKDVVSDRGTIGYASPEMLNGTATGFEGDNFGAGIVIYFMLSRSTPFLAPTTELMIEKTNQCNVNMGYGCFEHLSQDCRDLILGLVSFHPHDRCNMVKALANKALLRKFKTVTEPNLRPLPRNRIVRPGNHGIVLGRNNADIRPYAPSAGELPDLRRVPPGLVQKNRSLVSS